MSKIKQTDKKNTNVYKSPSTLHKNDFPTLKKNYLITKKSQLSIRKTYYINLIKFSMCKTRSL